MDGIEQPVMMQLAGAAGWCGRHLDGLRPSIMMTARPEGARGTGLHRSVWLPNDGAECRGRAGPTEGDVGDPYRARRNRCVDDRALGRGKGIATSAASERLMVVTKPETLS